MDFARKILGKYGWKDGDGLGKNNNGIAKPLRATLKFDNAGFGADQAASDFNNHWWERVFNDAASNVEVKQDGETIKMELIDDGVEITTKGYSMKKLKKAKESRTANKVDKSENTYNNFLQAATLTNTGDEVVNPERIDVSDIEVTKVKVLTDDELFKACGGRTAHKGARHGLKLSGKLARLQQQEEELLAKMLNSKSSSANEESCTNKKLKKKIVEKFSEEEHSLKEKNKSSKKKRKHEIEEIDSDKDKTTKKKKKSPLLDVDQPVFIEEHSPELITRKNKRKLIRGQKEKMLLANDEITLQVEQKELELSLLKESTELIENSSSKTKKKKRKQKNSNPEEMTGQNNVMEEKSQQIIFENKTHKKSKKEIKNMKQ